MGERCYINQYDRTPWMVAFLPNTKTNQILLSSSRKDIIQMRVSHTSELDTFPWTDFRLPVLQNPSRLLCSYMYFTRVSPEALRHVSTRTGAGLLRSIRRELMAIFVAAATLLLTSDFFSMCMTLLLVEDVSPTALTH
jgi:hypothetical protein